MKRGRSYSRRDNNRALGIAGPVLPRSAQGHSPACFHTCRGAGKKLSRYWNWWLTPLCRSQARFLAGRASSHAMGMLNLAAPGHFRSPWENLVANVIHGCATVGQGITGTVIVGPAGNYVPAPSSKQVLYF